MPERFAAGALEKLRDDLSDSFGSLVWTKAVGNGDKAQPTWPKHATDVYQQV
jgi:hypothetical protein